MGIDRVAASAAFAFVALTCTSTAAAQEVPGAPKEAPPTLAAGYVRSLDYVRVVEETGGVKRTHAWRDEGGGVKTLVIDTQSSLHVVVALEPDVRRGLLEGGIDALCVSVESAAGPTSDEKTIGLGIGKNVAVATIPRQAKPYDVAISVVAAVCNALPAPDGAPAESAKVRVEPRDSRAISDARRKSSRLELLALAEQTGDELGGAGTDRRPIAYSKWGTGGHVEVDEGSELFLVEGRLDQGDIDTLATAEITNICVTTAKTTKDGKPADACASQTIAVANLSKNAGEPKTICSMPKSKDAYTFTITIDDGVCAPAPASSAQLLQRHSVRVETEDFGLRFPPLIVDSIVFGRTALVDIERPSQLARRSQNAKLGVNLFLWDKFREKARGKARVGRILARSLGLNVTTGLNVAPANVATRTQAIAMGLVFAIPIEERPLFIGYDVIVHGPELKDRGFLFLGVSGHETIELFKKWLH